LIRIKFCWIRSTKRELKEGWSQAWSYIINRVSLGKFTVNPWFRVVLEEFIVAQPVG
jgi:hypothetical protein